MSVVLDLLNRRLATRAIDPTPLPEAGLDTLIEAARLAPSCMNKQPWRYLFLVSEEGRALGAAALASGNRAWASRAPLLVVAYGRTAADCTNDDGRRYYPFDLGLSVMNLLLAATELGWVARPMAGFDPEAIRQAFGLDPDDEPLVVVAVGLPSEDDAHVPPYYRPPRPRTRLGAGEIVSRR